MAGYLFCNGEILTANLRDEAVEACLTDGGEILFAGALSDAVALSDDETAVYDLSGRTLVPSLFGTEQASLPDAGSRASVFLHLAELCEKGSADEAPRRLIADRARGLSCVDAPKSIEWGRRADLAVLSGTLTQLSPDEIAQMSLDELFLFGESVYRRESDERLL
jgi:hypothetical protein